MRPHMDVVSLMLLLLALLAACQVAGPAPQPSAQVQATAPAAGPATPAVTIPGPVETPGLETTEAGPEEPSPVAVNAGEVVISSAGLDYLSYLAAPEDPGPHPGIILIHSFNGLEGGYLTLTDRFAAEGYVVLAIGWQTFERSPDDNTMSALLSDSVAYLKDRPDVDSDRIGLTGFCAGGRHTMLFLPQNKDFKAGVAWYGFPYRGDTRPVDLVDDLSAPLLIIHGTADSPSPIEEIYQYAEALENAGKEYELKVYEGEPHGFMLSGGQLRADSVAEDAYQAMVLYFDSWLR